MKKYLTYGIFSAVVSSSVVAIYLYSIYGFIPKGSPSPLVEPESLMRKELTFVKVIGLYVLASLFASLFFMVMQRFLGKVGLILYNSLLVASALAGFYYVLTFQKEGWDSFQIIGAPLFYILPLVLLALEPFFLKSLNDERN